MSKELNVKGILESKTLIINGLTALLTVADMMAGTDFINPEYLVAFVTVANIVLRFMTKGPVSMKKSK